MYFVVFSDWMITVAFILNIKGLLIALHFKRRETPTNFILLTAFVSTMPLFLYHTLPNSLLGLQKLQGIVICFLVLA
jgi:hypothetical protein